MGKKDNSKVMMSGVVRKVSKTTRRPLMCSASVLAMLVMIMMMMMMMSNKSVRFQMMLGYIYPPSFNNFFLFLHTARGLVFFKSSIPETHGEEKKNQPLLQYME